MVGNHWRLDGAFMVHAYYCVPTRWQLGLSDSRGAVLPDCLDSRNWSVVRRMVERPVVDPEYFWRPIDTYPGGSKALLLNRAGMAVVGKTTGKDDWFVAWCPLPKIPPDIKQLLGNT